MRRDVTLLITLYLCNDRHIVLLLIICIDNSETGRKEKIKLFYREIGLYIYEVNKETKHKQ